MANQDDAQQLSDAGRRAASVILTLRNSPAAYGDIEVEPADLNLLLPLRSNNLAELLCQMVRELTADQWTMSPCDQALVGPTPSGGIMLILHPANVEVGHLDEVPADMRLIHSYPPFRAFYQCLPESPDKIANNRQLLPAYLAEKAYEEHARQACAALLAHIQRALETSGPDMHPRVWALTDKALAIAQDVGDPSRSFPYLMEAASYLGIFDQMFASLLKVKED